MATSRAQQLDQIVPGTTIAGRYRLIKELGKGSMGSVWLGQHLALESSVAVKFIDRELTKHPDFVNRFQQEARSAAQLNSPNVVKVMDYGLDDAGHPFIVMEHLDGVTLDDYLEVNPKLGIVMTARIVADVCRGLSSAHAAGIIHRDIKPENLFLCDGGEGCVTKLLDFGVAKAIYNQQSKHTAMGQLVGSPAYMSPEQARGKVALDLRSDLFSVGIVAYECLTGTNPFQGGNVYNVLMAICSSEPEPAANLVPNLPPDLNLWFARALAKDRDHRFRSAREMSRSFREAAGLWSRDAETSAPDVPGTSSMTPGRVDTRSAPTVVSSPAMAPAAVMAPMAAEESSPGWGAPATTQVNSRKIEPRKIVDTLALIGRVPHVHGVALVGHGEQCLLQRGVIRDPSLFATAASRARAVADTLEAVEGAGAPTLMTGRFGGGTVYVRWFGSTALVVLGSPQLRSILLTVGSNRLASQLDAFASVCGGPDLATEALRAHGITGADGEAEEAASTTGPGVVPIAPPVPQQPVEPAPTGRRAVPGAPRLARSSVPGAQPRNRAGAAAGGKVRRYRGRVIGGAPEPEAPPPEETAPTPVARAVAQPAPAAAAQGGAGFPPAPAPTAPTPFPSGLTSARLASLVAQTTSASELVVADADGIPLFDGGTGDPDVTAAVAAVGHAQVQDLGGVLTIGTARDWLAATTGANLYIWSGMDDAGTERLLVAAGPPDPHPAKVADMLAKAVKAE